MKTALVTTTIHVPRVLELLRKYDSDVHFFVAGDLKTPDEAEDFCVALPNCTYLSPNYQKSLGYKCSELIGWNCIQRRAIALLEALKWGAELIVTWDDDNLPMNDDYFFDFRSAFYPDYNGLQVSSGGWFNQYGTKIKHRGFPIDIGVEYLPIVMSVTNAKVGVVAGLCLGDPDIDAYTRMALRPNVVAPNELERNGYLVAPNTKCVFNSQNTAFLRQFAPAMFCAPGLGRGDDIFASLLTQRVMKDAGYQVHLGPPFAYQERNHHDLLIDLQQELFCMEHLLPVSRFIDEMPSYLANVFQTYRRYWLKCPVFSEHTRECALAFLEDCEAVMK